MRRTSKQLIALVIMVQLTPVSAALDTARQAELLYLLKHDCGSCHGMTLKGGLGPALLPETLSALPKEYVVTTIMEGRKNTAMPHGKACLAAMMHCGLQNSYKVVTSNRPK